MGSFWLFVITVKFVLVSVAFEGSISIFKLDFVLKFALNCWYGPDGIPDWVLLDVYGDQLAGEPPE